MVVEGNIFTEENLKTINKPALRRVYKYLTGESGYLPEEKRYMRKDELIDAILASSIIPPAPVDPMSVVNVENMSVRVRRIYEAKQRGEQL